MFHVNTCDFLPVEDSMRCTSQTPAKFGVCYRIAELTTSIKLTHGQFMSWFICLFISVVMEVQLTLSLINVTKQFQ